MNIFAVLGNPISHSMSPVFMNEAFHSKDLDAIYTRILAQNILDLDDLLSFVDLKGLNITAPFKKDILGLVNNRSPEVERLGVCNTIVKNNDGQWNAFNTDVTGSVFSLWDILCARTDLKILVIGAGGAAAAALYGWKQKKAKLYISNRDMQKATKLAVEYECEVIPFESLPSLISTFSAVINTTPVVPGKLEEEGLKGKSVPFFLDANYNVSPFSKLLKNKIEHYLSGKEWLLDQGLESFQHFTGVTGKRELFASALDNFNGINGENIVLIGPMASGKSTIGKILAKKLGYSYQDIDMRVVDKTGNTISDLFKDKGEGFFRKLEKEEFKASLEEKFVVIACGGGIILDEENRDLLKKQHTILLLVPPQTSVDRNKGNQRPLLEGKLDSLLKARTLFDERLENYLKSAHTLINANSSSPEQLAQLIADDYISTYR